MKGGTLLGSLVALTLVGGGWTLVAPRPPGGAPGLPRLRPGAVWRGEGVDDPEVRALAKAFNMALDPKDPQSGVMSISGPYTVELDKQPETGRMIATVRRAWWPLW